MKILVTSSSGFLGRALIHNLANKNHDAFGLDRHPRPVLGMCFAKKGDILDRKLVFDLVGVCDGVINLAEASEQVVDAIRINTEGVVNVFDAAEKFGKPVVQIMNEEPYSAYCVTKGCAEKLAFIYNRVKGQRIAMVRAMNVYGPHQPVEKFIPNAIRSALLRQPIKIYGMGQQEMDPIYVDDVAEILARALLMDHKCYNRAFEAGSGRSVPVNDVADLIWRLVTGETVAPKTFVPMRPEYSEIKANLETLAPIGPVPMIPLELGMFRTVEWYRQRPEFLGL